MRASQELPVQHAGNFHIGDEPGHPSDLLEPVDSRNSLTNILVAQGLTGTIAFDV
jgi:hypothetical protein